VKSVANPPRAARTSFRDEAESVLRSDDDRPITVTWFNHRELVSGLHALVYRSGTGFRRSHLRIAHSDGSESAPFPVIPLTQPPLDSRVHRLRLGFISGRHPERDTAVDFYLIRNREVEQMSTSADAEQEIFERTLRLLRDPTLTAPLVIEVLHTGLEVATVGFYRGVVESIRRSSGSGQIGPLFIPRIWAGGEVNLDDIIGRVRGSLERGPVLHLLRAQADVFPDHLHLQERTGGTPSLLRWIPERPMWASERDRLCHRASGARLIFEALFQKTQYRDQQHWG
jgi:hypothetical protein